MTQLTSRLRRRDSRLPRGASPLARRTHRKTSVTKALAVTAGISLLPVFGLAPPANAADTWCPPADRLIGDWCVRGAIKQHYDALGGWNFFGNPGIPESVSVDNGRFQWFHGGPNRAGSSIYYHPRVGGAQQVGGAIRDVWGREGWEAGALGYPRTNELATPDGRGRFNHFEGGSIYHTAQTAAQPIWGRIRDYWSLHGWERSRFGYPTGKEYAWQGATQQNFENGYIQWVPPNFSTLPSYQSSWGSYTQVYNVFSPEPNLWSPESINREVTTNFDAYFTFTGCGSVLRVGAVCNLETVIGADAPVRVANVTATGFAFRSLDGHPEGANRLITFNFSRFAVGGANDLRLNVNAWGPAGGSTYTGPLNSETIARYAWSTFVNNIRSRLENARTRYVTGDQSVRPLSRAANQERLSPQPSTAPESTVIDPDQYSAPWMTTKVPLIHINEPQEADGTGIEAELKQLDSEALGERIAEGN